MCRAVIVFLVQKGEVLRFDQRPIEYTLNLVYVFYF